MFDAHYTSNTLIQVGTEKTAQRHTQNPILLTDLFFRIGGFRPAKVYVDRAVELNSNDVIGDHFWIWRADHGVRGSVGWEINTTRNGLVVNGDHVTITAYSTSTSRNIRLTGQENMDELTFINAKRPMMLPHRNTI